MPSRFLPSAVARAYREEHPGLFEGVSDAALLDAIKVEDPDTWAMVDESLLGEELLPSPAAGPAARPTITPPPLGPSGLETTISTGLRVVPGVAGSFFGPVGGAVGAGAGEVAGQLFERGVGLREEFTPTVVLSEAAIGAVPGAGLRRLGRAGRVIGATGTGAGLSSASLTGRTLLEQERLPSGRELLESAALGGAFGAGVGGAAEGIGALARRAPSFGESTGALPIDGGPPPRPPDLLPIAQAAAAQYEVEEAQLARQLLDLYGPGAARPSTAPDYHTALQAKNYLTQIAQLSRDAETLVRTVEMGPAVASATMRGPAEVDITLRGQPSQPLLPERAGPGAPPPGPIRAFPPGTQPEIELVGAGAPPASRVVDGRDVGAVQPPPTFEQALEASLQAPPGEPRLVRPMVLSSPGVPRGIAEPPPELISRSLQPFGAPIRQGAEVGGRPATPEQPLLGTEGRRAFPAILEPGVDRPYATGPNAGPRRAPRQEPHGVPRQTRRQIQTGKKISYEYPPSKLPAEDPGTYPPEVRRELAAMAWELDQFRHERIQGGVSKGMMEEFGGDVAEMRRRGATAGGAIAGAPVYHDIIRAAQGSFPHVKRADMLKHVRTALLEGKGTGLSDAAAQVARSRIAQRQAGQLEGGPHNILAQRGDEGDALIGWVDESGVRALPDQDLDPFQQSVREAEDGELVAARRIEEQGGIPEDLQPFYDAARAEGVRRGLWPPEQPGLPMEGPGGARGPTLFDFEGEPPPTLSQAERNRRARAEAAAEPPARQQARWVEAGRQVERRIQEGRSPTGVERRQPVLPGAEGIRTQEVPTPPVAEAPFALTPPPAKPTITPRQPSLLKNLLREEGVLILDAPAGDRTGLRRWLRRQEGEYGGTAWFNRVEQAIEEGNWDRAWKTAAAASAKSVTAALAAAKTPQQQQVLLQALHGTPFQEDLPTSIVTAGRTGQQRRPAPPVKGFPPSARVGMQERGITVGPAGILDLGPPQRPIARGSRAHVLDQEVMSAVVDVLEETPEVIHLVRGNRDTALRLHRQLADAVAQGLVPIHREDFPGLSRYEIGRQIRHTASEAGRTLQRLSRFTQDFDAEVHEINDRLDMGAAFARTLPGRTAGPPPMRGAGGRPLAPSAERALQEIATDLRIPEASRAAMMQDLMPRRQLSLPQAALNAQYAVLTSGLPTAIRNAINAAHRYSFELFDDLLTIPFGRPLEAMGFRGEAQTAAMAEGRVQERLRPKTGWGVTPRRALHETFEDIYGIQAGLSKGMSARDARQTLRIMNEFPAQAAHLLGVMEGENLRLEQSKSAIFNWFMDPKVRRWFQIWNRTQEMSFRGLAADTHFRAELRARGLDPAVVLQTPELPDIAARVGGERELEGMMFRSAAAARELTYAGGFARNSIPGWLVHMVNEFAPAKLAQRFPGFSFARAPRWIWAHGPWSSLDLLRMPFDRAGWTSTGKYLGGGRLYRGVRAAELERDIIPAQQGKLVEIEGEIGRLTQEIQGTSREWRVRQRQVPRLEQRVQPGLPETRTALENAVELRDQLGRRRERLQGQLKEQLRAAKDLETKIDRHWETIRDAQGISAPTYASWLGQMLSGTVGMLGAAVILRSSEGAEGTRYYQYRFGREGDEDAFTADTRAFSPIPQFLFVADVLVDFWRHTRWEDVRTQLGEDFAPGETAAAVAAGGALGAPAGPPGAVAGAVLGLSAEQALKWNRAIWENYEGKYTPGLLGAEFADAFLSISRAAGTTLTVNELLTRNGWPSLDDAAQAIVGTFGQWLAGWAVPLGQVKDVLGEFLPEEAKVRETPKVRPDVPGSWSYPFAQPLARMPGAGRLLPESISQTTGQPIRAAHPGLRVVTGLGGTYPDFVQEEARRVGLPGSMLYIRETGFADYDRAIEESYPKILAEELPGYLEDPEYIALGTPARQRDYLQRYVFPVLRRAAVAEAREIVGEERFTGATVRGEEARKRARQQRAMDALEAELDADLAPELRQEMLGAPPPGPPATEGAAGVPPPPPPPF